jgi:hypothetical protein
LKEQVLIQIPDDNIENIIERYYKFDKLVMRELLGLKLTHRQRKDLDEITEKTGCRIRSVRRQFDNLKRINRVTEEYKGSLIKNIIDSFSLPTEMAEQYAAILFIARNQFEITKRKLNYLKFDDFIYCANQMIQNWSTQYNLKNESFEGELSRDFLMNLKVIVLKLFI